MAYRDYTGAQTKKRLDQNAFSVLYTENIFLSASLSKCVLCGSSFKIPCYL